MPRQVILNDEIWNLFLAHLECDQNKSDLLVYDQLINVYI